MPDFFLINFFFCYQVDGNRDVLSKKTFSGQVTIKSSLSVDQNVNGIANFSQQVVELSEGGTVYGMHPQGRILDFIDLSRIVE